MYPMVSASLGVSSILLSLLCSATLARPEATQNYMERIDPTPLKLVVGGYSGKIVSLEFDPSKKTFQSLSATPAESSGKSPSFIGFSPDGRCMFATNEVLDFRGLAQTGSVTSFKIEPDNSFRPISTALTAADPAALAVSPDGKNLVAAEYTAGSWSRHALNNDCGFESENPTQVMKYHGSGPNPQRQDHSYIHQVSYNRAGDLLFAVDLGGDAVYVHRVDPGTGRIGEEVAHEIKLPAGTGPRHLSMVEQRGEYDIYLISELSNKLFTIRLTDEHNELKTTIRQTLSTVPGPVSDASTYAAGEVMVSRDGRYVYGSNRQTDFSKPGTDNSIVVFARNVHSGLLENPPRCFPLPAPAGKTPRHFSFSNDPRQAFLVVGSQQANTLSIFRRHSHSGALEFLASTPVESPAVQLFLPNHHKPYSHKD
ncbi:hypothetical protein PtA15_2A274 [Puccinia triticina]|uniref:6-phosphogluconolactonase n=1 Tax=Puccinia triticina TaxID=208348 RepID=A0ABY7C9V4_9BASI|nr:uncharacterized protein PtA15_2A274 [Puccinia triticina]WAQ81961.1 hypothetical protein PtA15_2A274 [Puccinia triticina]